MYHLIRACLENKENLELQSKRNKRNKNITARTLDKQTKRWWIIFNQFISRKCWDEQNESWHERDVFLNWRDRTLLLSPLKHPFKQVSVLLLCLFSLITVRMKQWRIPCEEFRCPTAPNPVITLLCAHIKGLLYVLLLDQLLWCHKGPEGLWITDIPLHTHSQVVTPC